MIETKIRPASPSAPIVLDVTDPDALAQRCWDAGFTVHVNHDDTNRAPVSVVDPFGRRIDLAQKESSRCTSRSA